MARINIEDSLFKDCRFMELLIKVGDQDKALGILTRAWMIAQKWWLTPGKTIPLSEWKKQKLSDALIEVGLAEIVDGKIRMAGAEEQFGWLEQRVKAGRKGGLSKGPRNDSTIQEAVAKRSLPVAKPLSLSPSLKEIQERQLEPKTDLSAQEAPQDAGASRSPPPLAKIWNEHRGQLPGVKGCGSTRLRKAQALWRKNPSTEYWAEIVRRIASSPFCLGDNNRGWRATFDFLLQPETQNKVLEGLYDRKASSSQINTKPLNLEFG